MPFSVRVCVIAFSPSSGAIMLTAARLQRRSEQKQNHRQEEQDAEQKPCHRAREVLYVSQRVFLKHHRTAGDDLCLNIEVLTVDISLSSAVSADTLCVCVFL